MGRIIAIANQKGGVGKTTTSVNLAASLAALGKRCLLVDCDAQANSSSGVGVRLGETETSIYELLLGLADFDQVVRHLTFNGTNLDLLPGHIRLVGAEVELISVEKRETRLKDALDPQLEKYDYIFLDTPPSLGFLTVNALTAADSVIIPLQCEFYALEGITKLLRTIRKIQKSLNPNLRIEGVLLTMYDGRTLHARQVAEDARKYFEGCVFETVIGRNIRISEAPSFGIPVLMYDKASVGAKGYSALAKEVLAHG